MAEIPEGMTSWLLCTEAVSIGRTLKWTSQEGRKMHVIENNASSLLTQLNSTVMGLCKSHGKANGSVLVVGIPEEIIHSKEHDGAYLSLQQSLLVFCHAHGHMSGIYTCGDNSTEVKRVQVCINGTCSPGLSTTPMESEEITISTISLVVLLGVAIVFCMVSIVLTSTAFWSHRKKKTSTNNSLQQIQLARSTALAINNHYTLDG